MFLFIILYLCAKMHRWAILDIFYIYKIHAQAEINSRLSFTFLYIEGDFILGTLSSIGGCLKIMSSCKNMPRCLL